MDVALAAARKKVSLRLNQKQTNINIHNGRKFLKAQWLFSVFFSFPAKCFLCVSIWNVFALHLHKFCLLGQSWWSEMFIFHFRQFYLGTLDGGGSRDFLVFYKPSEFLFVLIVYSHTHELSGMSRFREWSDYKVVNNTKHWFIRSIAFV